MNVLGVSCEGTELPRFSLVLEVGHGTEECTFATSNETECCEGTSELQERKHVTWQVKRKVQTNKRFDFAFFELETYSPDSY